MSEPVYVAVICEGPTERTFIDQLLAPHFHPKGIYLTPTILTKKGEKGGDVRYARLYNDLETHLGHGHNRCVTTLFDFYGLKGDWPGYEEAKLKKATADKHEAITSQVREKVNGKLEKLRSFERFLPYFAMHEIEALYFSDPAKLAAKIGVDVAKVAAILAECGEPEAINHERETSPSHRIESLGGSFRKTSTGIAVAKQIGLPRMREKCPLFDQWVGTLEKLA